LTAALNSALAPIKVKSLTPIKDHVLVSEMQFNERYSAGGIFLPSDDGQVQGIIPRWGKVYAVGPEQEEIKPGNYVCVAHGRWTRGINIIDANDEQHTIRRIDVDDILMVSDEEQLNETMGRPL
jgi:co-chaperonin GroES (HSP10)